MSTTTLPKVGDTVRADFIPGITGRIYGANDPTGQAVTVLEVREMYTYIGNDGSSITGPVCLADFTLPGGDLRYYFSAWTPVIEEIPAEPEKSPEPEKTPEQVEIERLKRELDSMRDNFRRTVTLISETMNEEAENRGWCETFDGIIDGLNAALPGPYYLERRESEYTVEVSISYSGTVSYELQVTARNFEDAAEMVADDPTSFFDPNEVIINEVRYGGVGDYEVEVI